MAPPGGFGTIAIHVGQEPEKNHMNPVVPPISISTTFKQLRPGEPIGHDYSRAGNPSRDALQECLAGLEGGKKAFCYSSGLGATMSMANILKSGDQIICSDDVYGGTQRYFRKVSEPNHGIKISMVDLTNYDALKSALNETTKMVWFETPSNPLLKVVDIVEVSKIVREYNQDIIIVVDSTFMTPYFQRPLELGATVVLHSITKYLNGHSDVVMGCCITNDEKIMDHLFKMQLFCGAIPSPFDCALVNRGLKTLHLRMKCHGENGLAVAKYLEANPRVVKVLYPGLASHPQHDIHKKQTRGRGMSGMISFYLKGELEESNTFLSSLKVFTLAESLGGYESLAELPSVMTHASVPAEEREVLGISDSLIRISVGCEDVEDLIADIEQALRNAIPSL
uniref:Cystathionine gamma-lyase n=1 Tax=Rhabditophanes sp. KR3021 TaxID=114890 RepID=A0AC35TV93_9BILA